MNGRAGCSGKNASYITIIMMMTMTTTTTTTTMMMMMVIFFMSPRFYITFYVCGYLSQRILTRVSFNKTRTHVTRNIRERFIAAGCMLPQRFLVLSLPYGKPCFQGQILLPRCKLFFAYTAENFNENPNM